jgi:ribonuclease HI
VNLIAYIDGGSRGNPGPSAAAFVVTDRTGQVIAEKARFLGRATNNEAEYHALLELLAWLGKNSQLRRTARDAVYVRCDSQLLVQQVTGGWKVKEPRLKELLRQVQELKKRQPFRLYIRHIVREKNKVADKLVNEAIDGQL